jgi:acetylornithine/N-succinyldiaminopimelate aminotransferase
MAETAETLEHGNAVLMQNYGRLPVVMLRGHGAHLWDADGKQYIDLFAGFGAAILGHCHPALISAATAQAGKLWHVGNTFYTTPQIELGERLAKFAFKGQAFFCHSGLEANEAAIKLARLRGHEASPRRWKVVSLHRSFHGRSLAMIAATGNPSVKVGFEPTVPGFVHVEMGDVDGLAEALDPEVAAVIAEPLQGEGGIHPMPLAYARELRRLCDERGITLIFDEVWTGCGRTGRWFGHQHLTDAGKPILPDIMTLGKAVGGGLPVGITWARPEVARFFTPGKHGCTLGGNPICMAVSRAVFDTIDSEKLTDRAAVLGEYAAARLRSEKKIAPTVAAVRGRGLMLGIELKDEPAGIVERGLANGVVLNLTAKRVIRLAPPLNIGRQEWDQGLDRVIETIAAG